MATTQSDVDAWAARGRALGATHLIVVCDTFDYEDYPVFVKPDEDLAAIKAEYDEVNMQRIMETVAL